MMSKPKDFKLLAALAAFGIIWGTTYLGIRIAVETVPPWFVVAIRQLIATGILLVYLISQKELKWIGFSNFKRHFILGILMFVIANGLTTVAERVIPSGLTSLLTSISPIVVFLGSLMVRLQKPSIKGFVGVALGFSGVAFIFREGFSQLLDPSYLTGVFTLAVGICGWAVGTIYSKMHAHKSSNLFLDLCYQFGTAALLQLILAFIFSGDTNVASWSARSIGAIVYLAVFGSVIAYFAYTYALQKVSAVQVSILSYFNTIIALFLGWLVLDEPITVDLLIATVLIIAGVFITNYKKKESTVRYNILTL